MMKIKIFKEECTQIHPILKGSSKQFLMIVLNINLLRFNLEKRGGYCDLYTIVGLTKLQNNFLERENY